MIYIDKIDRDHHTATLTFNGSTLNHLVNAYYTYLETHPAINDSAREYNALTFVDDILNYGLLDAERLELASKRLENYKESDPSE